jgi:hypothetical protein
VAQIGWKPSQQSLIWTHLQAKKKPNRDGSKPIVAIPKGNQHPLTSCFGVLFGYHIPVEKPWLPRSTSVCLSWETMNTRGGGHPLTLRRCSMKTVGDWKTIVYRGLELQMWRYIW